MMCTEQNGAERSTEQNEAERSSTEQNGAERSRTEQNEAERSRTKQNGAKLDLRLITFIYYNLPELSYLALVISKAVSLWRLPSSLLAS